jgi:hypothetical protein
MIQKQTKSNQNTVEEIAATSVTVSQIILVVLKAVILYYIVSCLVFIKMNIEINYHLN